MRAEDFHEFTRRQPFTPFRIHTTEGKWYDVHHPDQVMPMRSRVIVGLAGDDDVPDRSDHISLIHVVRLEPLDAGASREAGE